MGSWVMAWQNAYVVQRGWQSGLEMKMGLAGEAEFVQRSNFNTNF